MGLIKATKQEVLEYVRLHDAALRECARVEASGYAGETDHALANLPAELGAAMGSLNEWLGTQRGERHAVADLTGMIFTRHDLTNADFSGTVMQNVDLYGAHLRGVNFANTDLTGATLDTANLSGAILRNTVLDDAMAYNVILQNTTVDGVQADRLETNHDGLKKLIATPPSEYARREAAELALGKQINAMFPEETVLAIEAEYLPRRPGDRDGFLDRLNRERDQKKDPPSGGMER